MRILTAQSPAERSRLRRLWRDWQNGREHPRDYFRFIWRSLRFAVSSARFSASPIQPSAHVWALRCRTAAGEKRRPRRVCLARRLARLTLRLDQGLDTRLGYEEYDLKAAMAVHPRVRRPRRVAGGYGTDLPDFKIRCHATEYARVPPAAQAQAADAGRPVEYRAFVRAINRPWLLNPPPLPPRPAGRQPSYFFCMHLLSTQFIREAHPWLQTPVGSALPPAAPGGHRWYWCYIRSRMQTQPADQRRLSE
ncbi:hypothetical protein KCP78_25670 [Salmonella enterica subsp. enterica]|nr:hypothetical protein KCP78_25670 [Salmonella enterica subsp. enterica]